MFFQSAVCFYDEFQLGLEANFDGGGEVSARLIETFKPLVTVAVIYRVNRASIINTTQTVPSVIFRIKEVIYAGS